MICDADELDDIDPKSFCGIKGAAGLRREESGSIDICLMCGKFGKDKELWFSVVRALDGFMRCAVLLTPQKTLSVTFEQITKTKLLL